MLFKSCPAKVKAAGEQDGLVDGQFEAIVSVFGNKDSYGDVVMPGAFKESLDEWATKGDPIPVYYSHRMDDPDYNIGYVLDAKETDDGLWVRAQLDLDDDAKKARQVYKLLKGRRLTQFSFAYDIDDGGFNTKDDEEFFELRKLSIYEVGPTPIGANQETELLDVKSLTDQVTWLSRRLAATAKTAIAPHQTGTSDAEWDGPDNEANLSNDAGAATYRRAYAWADPDGDEDAKASYKFIHHEVNADGEVGAANLQACVTGIGVLNGGRGGSDIPDGDVQGVYDHLAKHLRDADAEPPELTKSAPPAKRGREISAKNETALREALEALEGAGSRIKNVLSGLDSQDQEKATDTGPAKDEEPSRAKSEEPSRGVPVNVLAAEIELLKIGASR